MSGRATSNLSRTLKTMSQYGLVTMEERPGRRVAPKVSYSHFKLEMPLTAQGRVRPKNDLQSVEHVT